MRARRKFSDDFEAKVALEALRGEPTVPETAARHKARPNRICAWQRRAVEGMGGLFSDKRETVHTDREREVHEVVSPLAI